MNTVRPLVAALAAVLLCHVPLAGARDQIKVRDVLKTEDKLQEKDALRHKDQLSEKDRLKARGDRIKVKDVLREDLNESPAKAARPPRP